MVVKKLAYSRSAGRAEIYHVSALFPEYYAAHDECPVLPELLTSPVYLQNVIEKVIPKFQILLGGVAYFIPGFFRESQIVHKSWPKTMEA